MNIFLKLVFIAYMIILTPQGFVLLPRRYDDLISGASLLKIFNAIANKGAKPINPLMVIANWTKQSDFNGFDVISVIHEKANIWSLNNCPLCASGSPAISARQHWQELNSNNFRKPKPAQSLAKETA